ncbi:ATP-binding cassette domain-containing protein [Saccharomonospora saliphila]|uniref:ATP-binding cassette domain-containing protein n=1 Tax=Saccharomonospora saliphila TaxID=369829 RepID=UPI000367FDC0|nr:ATP-binding cassette domain-containing protein [Saccharomonospora saliphila]
MTGPLLTLSGVGRSYRGTVALRPVDLRLWPGEFVALTGPSGSGKSTLLMLAGGWTRPDQGEITAHPPFPDVPVSRLGWRHLALVPQSLGLLDELTLAENVALAHISRDAGDHGGDEADPSAPARGLLDALDLSEPADRLATHASRGEQQRAALARALAGGAALVLADEPTSHQDRQRAGLVCAALRAAADRGTCVLVASHDPVVAEHADREVVLA